MATKKSRVAVNLFPAPRRLSVRDHALNLHAALWLIIPVASSDRLTARASDLVERLSSGLRRDICLAKAKPTGQPALLELCIDNTLPGEGFVLKLTAKERSLAGGSEAGLFYGLLAFQQIIDQFGETPPGLTVEDSPDFSARGIMLDVSRCKVPTMASLRLLIDRLAAVRINQLQLYTEHTFAFADHKAVWDDASPMTHEEVLAIDQYCRERFIELVPNFNSFGHFQRWLKHPRYRSLSECPELEHCSTLAPNAESLKLIASLYDELLPNFTSGQINVGCDETWELGKGRSKRRVEKSGATVVYLDFIKKIHKLCRKRGRRMQFWGDIILHQPELIKDLPEDVLALCWGYEGSHPYSQECVAFKDAGVEYFVCPGTSAWNSITGRTANALANLENAARNGALHGATGYLVTDWGDGGHHQVLPISYAGFAAGAAYSWCLKTNRDVDLAKAISTQFFGDRSGKLGQFCLELGKTLERMPGLVRGNCSCIHQLLFNRLGEGGTDISGLTKRQFTAAERWLDKVETLLTGAKPAGVDQKLVMDESRHALACARFAIHRGRFACGFGGSPAALKAELQGIVMSHEEQWLARNRRGGLHESSTRLRRVLARS